jgi:hypothetical protein
MMKTMKTRLSAAEVARLYTDFVSVIVLDQVDRWQAVVVEELGMRPGVRNTIMRGQRERRALARASSSGGWGWEA